MKVLCSQEVVSRYLWGRPMSAPCEGVCTSDPMVCALVRGSERAIRWGQWVQRSLIFMHFHGVFLGNQHEIWSKQHNGKVRDVLRCLFEHSSCLKMAYEFCHELQYLRQLRKAEGWWRDMNAA